MMMKPLQADAMLARSGTMAAAESKLLCSFQQALQR
jgi:hypothetical protein